MRLILAVIILVTTSRCSAISNKEEPLPQYITEEIGLNDDIRELEQISGFLRKDRPPDLAVLASERDQEDPIVLDYGGNHPFEKDRGRERDLEQERDDSKPLRIRFLTEPIKSLMGAGDSAMDEKITSIINDVLPKVSDQWSKHLSVTPTVGNIPLKKNVCFGMFGDTLPKDLMNKGIDNADVGVIVSGMDKLETASGRQLAVCSSGILAVALSCQLDQFDRPVVGFINFCVGNLHRRMLNHPVHDVNTLRAGRDALYQNNGFGAIDAPVLVATHEVAHILGMDIDLFKYYRDPTTGDPLTPRPFQRRNVQCVDGEKKYITFPGDNTIQIETDSRGRVHHHLVTPRVKSVVRNHFNCQTLIGARLENQPTALNSCSGSHWDEKHFFSEIMGPIFSGLTDILSPLTLAVMEDTGWYKVSYAGANLSPYGHGLGCDFVNEDCIIDDAVPEFAKGVFCDVPTEFNKNGEFVASTDVVCDPTHVSFAVCDLYDVSAVPSNLGPFEDDSLRYFSNQNLGSTFSRADFCPLPVTTLYGGNCRDPNNSGRGFYSRVDSFEPGSRCINAFKQEYNTQLKRPACLSVVCDDVNHQVIVNGQVCEKDGQIINFPFSDDSFECPRLTTICPELFCPAGCSGRGVCDYEASPPGCICDNPLDTSPSCRGVIGPTLAPSANPSFSTMPSFAPSDLPSLSLVPSVPPSLEPSVTISKAPSSNPSVKPTLAPSSSLMPSSAPIIAPSAAPSISQIPTASPSLEPSSGPTSSTMPSKGPAANFIQIRTGTSPRNFAPTSSRETNSAFTLSNAYECWWLKPVILLGIVALLI